MSKKEITWAPLIPLIGGQMLGAEKAFGKPPEAIYSYGGFEANDGHYVNYQQVTKGRDVPYVLLDSDNPKIKKVRPQRVKVQVVQRMNLCIRSFKMVLMF